MPIFEYHCSDCDREFEAYVSAERTAECPACQGTNLVKRLSSPGMVGASAGRQSSPAPMAGGCGAGGAQSLSVNPRLQIPKPKELGIWRLGFDTGTITRECTLATK